MIGRDCQLKQWQTHGCGKSSAFKRKLLLMYKVFPYLIERFNRNAIIKITHKSQKCIISPQDYCGTRSLVPCCET